MNKLALAASLVTGALTTDAIMGSTAPFRPEIQALRGQPGQISVAAATEPPAKPGKAEQPAEEPAVIVEVRVPDEKLRVRRQKDAVERGPRQDTPEREGGEPLQFM